MPFSSRVSLLNQIIFISQSRPPWLDPTFLDSIVPHYLGLYPDGIFLFHDPVKQCYGWQKGNSKLVISVKSKEDLENSGKKVNPVHCVRWWKKGRIMYEYGPKMSERKHYFFAKMKEA